MKRFSTPFYLAVLALSLGCSSSDKGGDKAKPGGSAGSGGGQSGSGGNADSGGGQSKAAAPNTVDVNPDQQRIAGIRVASVEPRSVPQTISVPAQVMMDEQRTAHISPYSDGRIVKIERNAGEGVKRGEVLAEMHSHSVHETVAALAQDYANLNRAEAALTYSSEKRDRYRHLFSIQAASLEQQQGSEQELVSAETDVRNAKAMMIAEREHLADLLQIEPDDVNPGTLYTYENIPIKTPITGTVITRDVTPGMTLQLGQPAYTVSDLTSVWVVASVNQSDLPHLRIGERVTVRSEAWGDELFPGAVTLVGSSLDPTTRTLQVRATLPNPRLQLKPQMFVTATIDDESTRDALLIPEDALQEVNGVQSVFVTTDGTHFTPRAVQTTPPAHGLVEVKAGLRPGEQLAVAGAFILKSDLLKGTLGDE